MTREEIEKAAWVFAGHVTSGSESFWLRTIHVGVIRDFAIQQVNAALEEATIPLRLCRTGCQGLEMCAHCLQKVEDIRALKIP